MAIRPGLAPSTAGTETETLRIGVVVVSEKVAVTLRADDIESVQFGVVPELEQSPPQLTNWVPEFAVATRFTEVEEANEAVHTPDPFAPQLLMPEGVLEIFPGPDTETFNALAEPPVFCVKVAETKVAWLTVMVQLALDPEQAPPQPEKDEPLSALAVRMTRP